MVLYSQQLNKNQQIYQIIISGTKIYFHIVFDKIQSSFAFIAFGDNSTPAIFVH